MKISTFLLLITVMGTLRVFSQNLSMPAEHEPHEGTWLQWPHNDLYGPFYQGDVQPTFVAMVSALQSGERVHIIAKNQAHETQIINALTNASVPMGNIDIYRYPTNDVWVRDNGPIFVFDSTDALYITDWGFNGWGNDTPFNLCNQIPQLVSADTQIPRIDLDSVVLEGGAIEHDGKGTMLATRSSVTHPSRNPNLSEQEIEVYLSQYLGFTKFIWLDGVYGTEITDMHIDGFVHFANDSTIVTMNSSDLTYWEVSQADQTTLFNATNVNNEPYTFVTTPLTQNNVISTFGTNLGYKGSYCNYYIGNDVVLVPTYNDPNDSLAVAIIQGVHPNRTAVGIDVRNIYEYGGMIHCLTQQQPLDPALVSITEQSIIMSLPVQLLPNPITDIATIVLPEKYADDVTLTIYQTNGQKVFQQRQESDGSNMVSFQVSELSSGTYLYQVNVQGKTSALQLMIIKK